ncbi:hypothetical protein [Nitrospira sp. Nam74]
MENGILFHPLWHGLPAITPVTFEGEYIRDKRTFDSGPPAIGQGIAPLPSSRFLGEAFNATQIQEYRSGVVLTQRFNDNWRLESRFRAEQASDNALFVFTKAWQRTTSPRRGRWKPFRPTSEVIIGGTIS